MNRRIAVFGLDTECVAHLVKIRMRTLVLWLQFVTHQTLSDIVIRYLSEAPSTLRKRSLLAKHCTNVSVCATIKFVAA